MQERWKAFVYPLIEDKKQDVEEEPFHLHIETQLTQLGWAPWKGEIKHKPNLRIGNRNSIQPDILVTLDEVEQFVIEVKRPKHVQSGENLNQLESYMRQLKLKVGIYVGERIEIVYDKPDSRHVVSVLQIPLELDEKRGSRFVELFSKENFSKEAIVSFCEERLKEMARQANLNKIKESLVADAQTQITESLKPYLKDKYGNSFSEEEIKAMLATMRFTASSVGTNGVETKPETIVKVDNKPESHLIKCVLTRNAQAKGLYDPKNQSLTVLKGSRVNANHLNKFSNAGKRTRDKQLEDFTELKAGQRIVKKDACFDSPSGAACFCVGGSANGWSTWKDEDGRELNEYRNNSGTTKSEVRFAGKRVTDPHQFQLDFWTRFRAKLEQTGGIPTLQTPQPRGWYDVRIGRSNILLNNVCNTQKNFVGVKLYIRNQAADLFFPALESRKQEINQALGCEPLWDANPSAQDKTIALFHQTNLTDPVKAEEALEWLTEQTIIWHRVFSEEAKKIN